MFELSLFKLCVKWLKIYIYFIDFIYLFICLLCFGGHTRGSEENCRSWFILSIMRILGIKPDLQAWQEDPLLAEPSCHSYQVIVFFSVDHGNSDHNVNTRTKGTVNQFCPDFTHETPVKESQVKPLSSGLSVFFPVRGHPCFPLCFHLMAGTSAYWESSACQHHLGTNRYLSLVLSDVVVVIMKWIIRTLLRKKSSRVLGKRVKQGGWFCHGDECSPQGGVGVLTRGSHSVDEFYENPQVWWSRLDRN